MANNKQTYLSTPLLVFEIQFLFMLVSVQTIQQILFDCLKTLLSHFLPFHSFSFTKACEEGLSKEVIITVLLHQQLNFIQASYASLRAVVTNYPPPLHLQCLHHLQHLFRYRFCGRAVLPITGWCQLEVSLWLTFLFLFVYGTMSLPFHQPLERNRQG